MKKECRRIFLCMLVLLAAAQLQSCSCSSSECLKVKDRNITYNSQSDGVDIYKGSVYLCKSVYSFFDYQGQLVKSNSYSKYEISSERQEDKFGEGYLFRYVGLDSGWNSFTEEQLASLVRICKENGQKVAVYWASFTDWGRNLEKVFEDYPEYKYNEDGTCDYVVFHYSDKEMKGVASLDRLKLKAHKKCIVKEPWSSREVTIKDSLNYTLPAKDVLLFGITK